MSFIEGINIHLEVKNKKEDFSLLNLFNITQTLIIKRIITDKKIADERIHKQKIKLPA